MRVEHNGDKFRIDFGHMQFSKPIVIETQYRGPREITAITDCRIIKGEKDQELIFAEGTAKCALGDRFVKEYAREKALRRAVDDIQDRELRGKLLMAYFTRQRGKHEAGD